MSDVAVRWMRFAGDVSEAERSRIRASPLYESGDTIAVWVNEGDILMHPNMDASKDDPQATLIQIALTSTASAEELRAMAMKALNWSEVAVERDLTKMEASNG